MNLKSLFLFVLLFASGLCSNAQSFSDRERIVRETVDALNNHTVRGLKDYLSPDFEFGGLKGAAAVEKLAGQQYGRVSGFDKVSESGQMLIYRFVYHTGYRDILFTFDEKDRLERLDISALTRKEIIRQPQMDVISVPTRLTADHLILVPVTVRGKKCTFVFDNGAERLHLNSKYFEDYERTAGPGGEGKGATGSIAGIESTIVDSLDFGGIRVDNAEADMSDLSHIEKECQVHGLLGYNVYKDYDILFDYPSGALKLIRPEYTGEFLKANGYEVMEEIPFDLIGAVAHMPLVEAVIGTRHMLLGIDSGAGSCLLDKSLWNDLKDQVENVRTDILRGVGGGNITVNKGNLKSMKIGGRDFVGTGVVFSDVSVLGLMEGVIGYDLLSKQKTVLSYSKRKIILIKDQ